jgi:hypothetical protein
MPFKLDKNLDIWIGSRKLWLTLHIRDEMDKYGKDTIFVAKVIDSGSKKIISKKEQRYEATLSVGSEKWIVVYFIMNGDMLAKHLGKDER